MVQLLVQPTTKTISTTNSTTYQCSLKLKLLVKSTSTTINITYQCNLMVQLLVEPTAKTISAIYQHNYRYNYQYNILVQPTISISIITTQWRTISTTTSKTTVTSIGTSIVTTSAGTSPLNAARVSQSPHDATRLQNGLLASEQLCPIYTYVRARQENNVASILSPTMSQSRSLNRGVSTRNESRR